MGQLHLAENLVMLRKERHITQDTLADFIGVSKASVSKWENGQSFPDIETLPKLASYFNRSIDQLMGYEAQLDRKKIRQVYFMLAQEFATKPFHEAYQHTVKWMKEYYSCYPFLQQIAILLLNHWMAAESEKQKQEVLKTVVDICERICEYSNDVQLCKDTLVVESICSMMTGKPERVLELLGETIRPYMGNDELIAQACQLTGQKEKAEQMMQVSIYQKVLSICQMGTSYAVAAEGDKEKQGEIRKRIQAVIDAFAIDTLNPNTALGFYYQSAVILCRQKQYEEAIETLKRYAETAKGMAENASLHGDAFFDKVEDWFEEFVLGAKPVRDKALIIQSIRQLMEDKDLEPLKERKEYKWIEKELMEL